jgi:hypothetical protein
MANNWKQNKINAIKAQAELDRKQRNNAVIARLKARLGK